MQTNGGSSSSPTADDNLQTSQSLRGFSEEQLSGLTLKQRGYIEKVDALHKAPLLPTKITPRTPEQIEASQKIHKRVNPGYVDLPYKSTSEMEFKYHPAPDFTRDYLKADSDIGFQKYVSQAILKGVDLRKTSH